MREKNKQTNKQKNKNLERQDLPGGPVIKTLPSMAGDVGSNPGLGAGIPRASCQNTET